MIQATPHDVMNIKRRGLVRPMSVKRRKLATAEIKSHLATLSIPELRAESELVGVKAGPIDDSTKDIYIRMIALKKQKQMDEKAESLSGAGNLLRKTLNDPTVSNPEKPDGDDEAPPKKKRKYTKKTTAVVTTSIKEFTIDGLTAATFTPMKPKGELNLPVIKKYADWLLSTGVKNVFVNGTTGESLSLTIEERKKLASEWIKVSAGRLKVIVHVGTENITYTCELAKHAKESGAGAIGVMPTTFVKPATIDNLILYLQKVADAAPSLPMYYYHIPEMTGVKFLMEDFLEAVRSTSRLPTLRGIKYTSTDLFDFGRCVICRGGEYQMVYGKDEQLIGALALGGTSAIGSTYNYAGKLCNRLISAYNTRDTEAAKLEQRRSQAMIILLLKYGAHAGGGKAFMKLRGIDCGPPRLPLLELTAEKVTNLESDLKDIGFFEWA